MGSGVVVGYEGRRLVVGNRRLLKENGMVLDASVKDYLTCQEVKGRTPVLVSVDSELVGVISVADTLREGVASHINAMRKNGVKKVVMLTGDNRYVAEKISKQVAIDETRAELLPEEKMDYIKACQGQGHKVVMIGDGINDAPALAVADVGIAMGDAGTDVAIKTVYKLKGDILNSGGSTGNDNFPYWVYTITNLSDFFNLKSN